MIASKTAADAVTGLAGTPEAFAWFERDAARKGGGSPKG